MAPEKINEKIKNKATEFSLLPLRNLVVFPNQVVPLFVGRAKSIQAIEYAVSQKQRIVLAVQKTSDNLDPVATDIASVGVLAELVQILKLPDGTTKILVEGVARVKIEEFVQSEPFFKAKVSEQVLAPATPDVVESLMTTTIQKFEDYVKSNKKIPSETLLSVINTKDPVKLSDLLTSYLMVDYTEKQAILELNSLDARYQKLIQLIDREVSAIKLDTQLQTKVKDQISKVQKEYFLKEKLKTIQKELGEVTEGDEFSEYQEKIKSLALSEDVEKKLTRELARLQKVPPASSEAGVIRSYLDWMVELPWVKSPKSTIKLSEAKNVLDADHYGLKEVKERILEYLAVYQLTGKIRGSILCLVGPPGVGKTSIGKSVARAMNRPFDRIALGGVRDQAELRGHRRTYVGAMPGRIISALHRVKANNPVIMLDEIDKMSTEYQGDPSAALLEILDPNQNVHFSDHYLDAPFDLSEVFFIATANSIHHLPRPLLDRLEIIQLSGYTESEKVEIIKKHLWPTLATEHGLSPTDIKYTDQNLLEIIRGYTKEAGVRDLSRTLSKIFRKAATQKLEEVPMMKSLNAEVIEEILGAPKYKYEHSVKHEVGLVTGLAWTQNGGETLTIEASVFKGRGALTLTGHLGEVMQESAKAAFTYVRSLASELGMSEKLFRSYDVHIHVPEGAIPKDGPSAGVAIVTALASAIFNVPVRADVAMTGEVTLRGRVLPIGGVKEKLMAASRLGIKRVLLPLENKRDFKKLEPAIYQNLEVIFVESAKEVLSLALVTPLEPVKSTENEDLPPFIDSPPDELRI